MRGHGSWQWGTFPEQTHPAYAAWEGFSTQSWGDVAWDKAEVSGSRAFWGPEPRSGHPGPAGPHASLTARPEEETATGGPTRSSQLPRGELAFLCPCESPAFLLWEPLGSSVWGVKKSAPICLSLTHFTTLLSKPFLPSLSPPLPPPHTHADRGHPSARGRKRFHLEILVLPILFLELNSKLVWKHIHWTFGTSLVVCLHISGEGARLQGQEDMVTGWPQDGIWSLYVCSSSFVDRNNSKA